MSDSDQDVSHGMRKRNLIASVIVACVISLSIAGVIIVCVIVFGNVTTGTASSSKNGPHVGAMYIGESALNIINRYWYLVGTFLASITYYGH